MLNENWQRPNRCDNSGPNCVETKIENGMVQVRDSKNPGAGPLLFSPQEWTAFVESTKNGQFDI